MLYREAGQFKTSYAADMAVFPIRQDRIALCAAAGGSPSSSCRCWRRFHIWPFGSDYLLRAILIPFLILSLAAIGLNILMGYCGQISLGSGAFMAIGAYCAYKFGTGVHLPLDWLGTAISIPPLPGAALDPARRPDVGHRRHPVRHPEPAHQGPLSGGGDAGGPVLLRLGVHPREVVHQLHAVGLGQRAGAEVLRLRRRHADRALSALPHLRDACSRSSPRTWCAAISAGNGWPSATWTSPPS